MLPWPAGGCLRQLAPPERSTCFQLDSPGDRGRVEGQWDVSPVQVDAAHSPQQVFVRRHGVVVVRDGGVRGLGAGHFSRRGGDLSVLGHWLPRSDTPCRSKGNESEEPTLAAKLSAQMGMPGSRGAQGSLPSSRHCFDFTAHCASAWGPRRGGSLIVLCVRGESLVRGLNNCLLG